MPHQGMRHCAKCGQSQTVTRSDAEDNTCHYCGAAMVKSSGVQGYLYILSNPSMPGLLKIGLTTRPVPERVAPHRRYGDAPRACTHSLDH